MAYLLSACGGHTAEHQHDHEHEEAHEEAHVHDHNHNEHDHDHHHSEHEHDHSEHEHEATAHDHEHEDAAAHAPNEIIFKEAQAHAIGLQTERVTPGEFTDVLKTSGQILAAQGDESVVVATVSGVVSMGSLPFIDGTAVRKGQALLSLASRHLQEGDYASRVQATFEAAEQEYNRVKELAADRIVSAKELEQARVAYETAKAAYQAVSDKANAQGVAVVSPQTGFLKNIQVKEGDYVTVGQPLATISQNSRLTLRADVSEKYYARLAQIQTAHFRTPYDDTVYKLPELRGRLLSYGKASGGDSFYVPVTFEFDNKGAVIPGSFVEVYLLTRPLEQVISVPTAALIEEQGIFSVYVRLDEEGYEKREVQLGANNGDRVQVLSGLHPDEEVVVKGAYQIKLASASNAIPAHSHQH